MEAPPQFAPPAPAPKKSNALLIIVLSILGLCAVCCIVGVIFFMNFFNKVKGFAGCTVHFAFVRQAMSDYAKAHGGKLPTAATWQDDIAPYYGKEKNGQRANGGGFIDLGDPAKNLGCAADGGGPATGMAFNADLAGKTITEAYKNPSQELLFEVPETGRNICKPYKAPPGNSPGTIMGKPRPWIKMPVSGSINVGSDQTFSSSGNMPGNGL